MISIVTASDDGYVHHLGGMLHSASLYHPQARYFLLDNGISAENADKLRGVAAIAAAKDIADRAIVERAAIKGEGAVGEQSPRI